VCKVVGGTGVDIDYSVYQLDSSTRFIHGYSQAFLQNDFRTVLKYFENGK
jgi:hypothetical protein